MENFLTKYPEQKEGRNALTTQRFKKWIQSFINNYPGLKPYNKKLNTYRQDNKHGIKFLVIE